jgi:F1F0 ATPase subunit 2
MQTTDLATWLGSALGGAALGFFFFGGLWWTVRAIVGSSGSAFVQLASLTLRTAATLLGFHAIGGGDARRLVACLAGFVLARVLVARWARHRTLASPMPEARHETGT